MPPWVVKRTRRMTNEQLLGWLDTTVIATGQSIDMWRYHSGPAGEVDLSLEALYGLWEELRKRGLTDQ